MLPDELALERERKAARRRPRAWTPSRRTGSPPVAPAGDVDRDDVARLDGRAVLDGTQLGDRLAQACRARARPPRRSPSTAGRRHLEAAHVGERDDGAHVDGGGVPQRLARRAAGPASMSGVPDDGELVGLDRAAERVLDQAPEDLAPHLARRTSARGLRAGLVRAGTRAAAPAGRAAWNARSSSACTSAREPRSAAASGPASDPRVSPSTLHCPPIV